MSAYIFKLGLFFVSLQACTLYIIAHDAYIRDGIYLLSWLDQGPQYVAMSIALLVGGALLFDLVIKEQQNNGR